MDNASSMGGLNRIADLHDNSSDLIARQWGISLGVALEDLACSPLNREVVQPGSGLSRFNSPHHIRMLNTSSELRFPSETGDGRPILPELFAEYLQCHN